LDVVKVILSGQETKVKQDIFFKIRGQFNK
jgi:hypothetical protein